MRDVDSVRGRYGLLQAGLLTGLAGGALDFAAASIIYPLAYPGLSVIRIWQSVAEGVLGKASYEGGRATAALGVCLHFFIAICAGAVFVFALTRAKAFERLWIVSGAVYGVSMYFFMQKIVLPLSLIGIKHPDAKSMAIGLGIHILIFGIGSAFVAKILMQERRNS